MTLLSFTAITSSLVIVFFAVYAVIYFKRKRDKIIQEMEDNLGPLMRHIESLRHEAKNKEQDNVVPFINPENRT